MVPPSGRRAEWGASGSDLPGLSSWNMSQLTSISPRLLLLPENRRTHRMMMVDFMRHLD